MLCRFTLHPTALQLSEFDYVQRLAIIATLARYWLSCGLLVEINQDGTKQSLLCLLDGVSADIRREWKQLFTIAAKRSRIRQCPSGTVFSFSEEPAVCLSRLQKTVELICLDRERGATFSIPPDKPWRVDLKTGIEVCRIDCVECSKSFGVAFDGQKGTFGPGEKRENIVKNYVEPDAQLQTSIAALDRYALVRHHDTQTSERSSGLEALLGLLNRMPADRYFTLYTSAGDAVDVQDLERSVRAAAKKLGPGSLAEIKVYMVNDSLFMKKAHYRYIRFGSDRCLILDSGLDVLEEPIVRRACPFHFDDHRPVFVGVESELRTGASRLVTLGRGSGLAKTLDHPAQ